MRRARRQPVVPLVRWDRSAYAGGARPPQRGALFAVASSNASHRGWERVARRGLALALAALLSGAALGGSAAPAWADSVDPSTRAAARKLGTDAIALYEHGDYAGALAKFTLANKLVPAPTLAIRVARCLVRLGRLVEASETYLEVTRTELDSKALAVHRKAVAEALAEREKILPMIPSLVVAVQGPRGESLAVSIDGNSVPTALVGERRPIDPGTHRIEVQRGADAPIVRQVTLDTGEAARVDIALPPLPATAPVLPVSAPAPREPVGKVVGRFGLALGAAGIVVGVSHGIAALVQQSSLVERCGEARACPPDAAGAVRLYDVTRVATTIGFVAAGAGLALSIPFFVTPRPKAADGSSSALRLTTWLGAGAGIRGEF